MTTEIQNHPHFKACVEALQAGGVIAYPTEGVWGLGCDPTKTQSVQSILDKKNRPVSKGLILASGNIEHFKPLLLGLDQSVLDAINASWPGPTTWLVPHKGLVPEIVHGDSDKVAIRVSAHPVVAALTEAFGSAIVSTSANPSGAPAATEREQVVGYFRHSDVTISPGSTGGRKGASTIIDALTGNVIRA